MQKLGDTRSYFTGNPLTNWKFILDIKAAFQPAAGWKPSEQALLSTPANCWRQRDESSFFITGVGYSIQINHSEPENGSIKSNTQGARNYFLLWKEMYCFLLNRRKILPCSRSALRKASTAGICWGRRHVMLQARRSVRSDPACNCSCT